MENWRNELRPIIITTPSPFLILGVCMSMFAMSQLLKKPQFSFNFENASSFNNINKKKRKETTNERENALIVLR